MAYSETLADRVRDAIGARDAVTERKMFGGLCLMVGGNMAVCVVEEGLMVRMDPGDVQRALGEAHVRPMEMKGRTMKGFVIVEEAALSDEPELGRWVDAGADFAASLPAK